MAFYNGYGYSNSFFNYGSSYLGASAAAAAFGGLSNGFNGWLNYNNYFTGFGTNFPHSSSSCLTTDQFYGGQQSAYFDNSFYGNASSFDLTSLGFNFGSTAAAPVSQSNCSYSSPLLDASTLRSSIQELIGKLQSNLQPPAVQPSLPKTSTNLFQFGLDSRIDFSKIANLTQTSTPAKTPATPISFSQFQLKPLSPTLLKPTPISAPTPAFFSFPFQILPALPAPTPAAAAAAAPSALTIKPAKSGKEAKPSKSIVEPVKAIGGEPTRTIKEVPLPAKSIKELAELPVIDEKSRNMRLIEAIMLTLNENTRRRPLSADGNLDLADVLDFYEWLREKKRRTKMAKMFDL